LIGLLHGEEEKMTVLEKIDLAAKNWNRTKNPRYKKEWYKLIEEFVNGLNNTKRWNISSRTSDEADDGKRVVGRKNYNKLF